LRTCPDRSWGPPSLLYTGYRVFPGSKERPYRDTDPHPLLVPWSRKSTSTPLTGRTACTEPQCLYKGTLYLYLPYPLYARSVIRKALHSHRAFNRLFLLVLFKLGCWHSEHRPGVLDVGCCTTLSATQATVELVGCFIEDG